MSQTRNTWIVNNQSDAFDLDDDLELRVFEQFCFLKPKLPYGKANTKRISPIHNSLSGFPSIGLLNRCPKPSAEHCFSNGKNELFDFLCIFLLF